MNRLFITALSSLVLALPACDININTGSGDTEDAGSRTGTEGAPPAEPGSSSDASTGEAATSGPMMGSSGSQEPIGDESSTGEEPATGEGSTTGDDPTGDDPTGDDPTGDDPTGEQPQSCGERACEDCIVCTEAPGETCGALTSACSGDPQCVAIADCYGVCAQEADQAAYEACWFDQCVANWPDGVDPFIDYFDCVLGVCESPCA